MIQGLENGMFFQFQKCERRQQFINRTILKNEAKFSVYKFEGPIVHIVFDSDPDQFCFLVPADEATQRLKEGQCTAPASSAGG
jgi:hypothetical protein